MAIYQLPAGYEVRPNLRYIGPGWSGSLPMHNYHILGQLGLQMGHHLPPEGVPPVLIGNVRVKVLPLGQGLNLRSRKQRRTVAECPKCRRWVCAGHLNQHMRIHMGFNAR